jgi:hypothetical protein
METASSDPGNDGSWVDIDGFYYGGNVEGLSNVFPFEFINTIPNNFQPTIVKDVAFLPGIPPVLNITIEDNVDHNSNDMTCLITNALPPLLAASQCHAGGGVQCCKPLFNGGRDK